MDIVEQAEREWGLTQKYRAKVAEVCHFTNCDRPLINDEEQETGVCDDCFWTIEGW